MANDATQKLDVPMMKGTEGKKDYLAFARKGVVALGIKPIAIHKGEAYGAPGHVWFGFRLRSANAAGIFADAVSPPEAEVATDQKVVQFKPKPKKADGQETSQYSEAWPQVTWGEVSGTRASTIIGIMVPGGTDDAAASETLLASVEGSKLATKIADHIEGLARKQNMMIERADVIAWFDLHYAGFITSVRKHAKEKELLAAEVMSSVGTVTNQAEMLKKVFKKTQETAQAEPEALVAGEQPEEDFTD